MGVFQTLREHGALPLVQIDEQGNMRCVHRRWWWREDGVSCGG